MDKLTYDISTLIFQKLDMIAQISTIGSSLCLTHYCDSILMPYIIIQKKDQYIIDNYVVQNYEARYPDDISLETMTKLPGLVDLRFHDDFIFPIDFPDNYKFDHLKFLTFGRYFNQNVDPFISRVPNLTHLEINSIQFQPISTLSNLVNLTHLTFAGYIDQDILPLISELTNLTHLTLPPTFNQSLGIFLDKLTKLEYLNLGYNFNQPIDKSLNNLTNLTELILSYFFDQSIEEVAFEKFPRLTRLTFGNMFSGSINVLSKLPQLKYLHFNWYTEPVTVLTKLINLTELEINGTVVGSLEPLLSLVNLKYLTFDSAVTHQTPSLSILSSTRLPNLTDLTFTDEYDQPIENLFNLTKLTHLYFGNKVHHSVKSLYKLSNLQQVLITKDFNQSTNHLNKLKEQCKITFLYMCKKNVCPNLRNRTITKFDQYNNYV